MDDIAGRGQTTERGREQGDDEEKIALKRTKTWFSGLSGPRHAAQKRK